ncbi:MAG: RecJ-like exonuclease [Candidatus Nitrosomirales archaeon]|jgi:RecJ-like exonuclease
MNTVCISHNRDVDGIVSAALIRNVTRCDVLLTDYEQMIKTMKSVENTNEIYICDLGLTEETEADFNEQLNRLKKTADIYYIDHHRLSEKSLKTIANSGIRVVHSTEDCASVLIHQLHKDKLPKQTALLAACSAVTDDIECGRLTKNILQRYDRDLILFEASVLSYAIAARGDDEKFLLRIVEELSKVRFPHQIKHLCEYASEYADRMLDLCDKIAQEGSKIKNIAHMDTRERSLGSIANFLVGEFAVPVGIAYRYKADTDKYIVSIRSSDSLTHHLGELTSRVSSIVGGLGGGHPNASGAIIPRIKLKEFLEIFNKELDH